MWDSFVNSISQVLQLFYVATKGLGVPSYGLAIIFFTLTIKAILFPLTAKQMKSMRALQILQPEIKKVQDKYKNDPQKAQQAVMNLYKEHEANPFSGCLPLIIQMPILFALFSALRSFFDPQLHPVYVDMSHVGFLWITNLGNPDPIFLPLLVVVATFAQQYFTTLATSGKIESNQKMMIIVMPFFVGWLSRTFPAGLSLYWVVFSAVGIFEQILINKQLYVAKGVKSEE